jgi:hypothetical protein
MIRREAFELVPKGKKVTSKQQAQMDKRIMQTLGEKEQKTIIKGRTNPRHSLASSRLDAMLKETNAVKRIRLHNRSWISNEWRGKNSLMKSSSTSRRNRDKSLSSLNR